MFRCVAINILMQFLGCKYCRNILNSNFVFCTSKYPPTYKINEPLLEYVVAGLYCWVEYVLTNHVVKSIDFMPELDNVNLLHRIELFTGTSSWWMLVGKRKHLKFSEYKNTKIGIIWPLVVLGLRVCVCVCTDTWNCYWLLKFRPPL